MIAYYLLPQVAYLMRRRTCEPREKLTGRGRSVTTLNTIQV